MASHAISCRMKGVKIPGHAIPKLLQVCAWAHAGALLPILDLHLYHKSLLQQQSPEVHFDT